MEWTRLVATAALLVLASGARAQFQPSSTPPPDFDRVEIRTTAIDDRIHLLQGEGGNIVVAAGDDGVLVVDSQFAPLYAKIKAAILGVTERPVRYLALTHFHRDHTGANESFARDGAIIVAHENVRTRLAEGTRNGLTGNVVPPAPEAALPVLTYTDGMALRLGGFSADLKHLPRVHTDGDTFISFPGSNVLVTGDIVTFGRYPNIDVVYGGSIDGMIRGVDAILAAANEDTKIVPGHGPLGTKAMTREYRQMLAQARDRIARLAAEGKSEDEIVALRPNADYDAKLGQNPQQAGNFVRVVYRSLPK